MYVINPGTMDTIVIKRVDRQSHSDAFMKALAERIHRNIAAALRPDDPMSRIVDKRVETVVRKRLKMSSINYRQGQDYYWRRVMIVLENEAFPIGKTKQKSGKSPLVVRVENKRNCSLFFYP